MQEMDIGELAQVKDEYDSNAKGLYTLRILRQAGLRNEPAFTISVPSAAADCGSRLWPNVERGESLHSRSRGQRRRASGFGISLPNLVTNQPLRAWKAADDHEGLLPQL
jgi:hypothetical protein